MKFATISAVFALGAVAACAGVPAETRVTSYGDAVPSTASQPATSTDDPAQKSAADVIAEAWAAAVRAETEEKPVPGDLAFSPTPQVSAEDEPNTQVASLPRQDPEPATEAPVNLLKQEPEPATEAPVTLLKQEPEPATEAPVNLLEQDPEPEAPVTLLKQDPEPEAPAATPRQDAEPDAEAPVNFLKPIVEPAAEVTGTPTQSAARTPEQTVPKPAARAAGRSYHVQLAAYRKPAGAEANWNVLSAAYPDLFADLSKTIRRADLGATRGIVHQLRVGPFAGEAEARALCETLKKRGADCFVVAQRRSRRP